MAWGFQDLGARVLGRSVNEAIMLATALGLMSAAASSPQASLSRNPPGFADAKLD